MNVRLPSFGTLVSTGFCVCILAALAAALGLFNPFTVHSYQGALAGSEELLERLRDDEGVQSSDFLEELLANLKGQREYFQNEYDNHSTSLTSDVILSSRLSFLQDLIANIEQRGASAYEDAVRTERESLVEAGQLPRTMHPALLSLLLNAEP